MSLAVSAPVAAEEPTIESTSADTANVENPASNAALIKRLYRTVFGRDAEPAGLKYWLEAMANGATYEDVVHAFLSSSEWTVLLGSEVSNEDYVEHLYMNGFGRASDDPGKAYWVKVLEGGVPRADLVIFFAESEEQRNATEQSKDFSLDVLHINDHHSHVAEEDITLDFGGVEAEVALGGFPRVVAAINQLEASSTADAVAKVHAGDAITGTLYYSLFKGEVDAALMNQVCLDVFALGNHEFDDSDEGLVNFLDDLNDSDCGTPVLAANIEPKIGTPLAPVAVDDYIQPFVIKTYGDQKVGYIGIDIKQKTQVSSSPLDTTAFFDEVETAQKYIDVLTAKGIDKIVLVTHQGYQTDITMASMLSGADAIIGGDSHSLIGDFDVLGLSPEGEYPTIVEDKTGLPVCVVQAWQYSYVVGQLNIQWDEYGQIYECDGTPRLLIEGPYMHDIPDPEDAEEEISVAYDGADLATIEAFVDKTDELLVIAPDAASQTILDGYSEEVEILQMTVIGTATEDLCLARIPGNTGRTALPDCVTEGVPHGGDIQQLVTYAFADRAFDADLALQNSGGVRVDVETGDYTIADAYTLLPFANTIFNLEMTGAEVKASLEEAVSNIIEEGGSSGAYPYAAYLRWDVDMTAAAGSRFSNLEFRAKGTDTWVPFDLTKTYTVAANSFMASGGDGYITLKAVVADGRGVDTFIDYAQGFIDYIEDDLEGTIARVPESDYSTQGFVPAAG